MSLYKLTLNYTKIGVKSTDTNTQKILQIILNLFVLFSEFYFPVDPNPPTPRWVSSSSFTSVKPGVKTGVTSN